MASYPLHEVDLKNEKNILITYQEVSLMRQYLVGMSIVIMMLTMAVPGPRRFSSVGVKKQLVQRSVQQEAVRSVADTSASLENMSATTAIYIVDRQFENAHIKFGVHVVSSPTNPPAVRRRGRTVQEHYANIDARHRILAM